MKMGSVHQLVQTVRAPLLPLILQTSYDLAAINASDTIDQTVRAHLLPLILQTSYYLAA